MFIKRHGDGRRAFLGIHGWSGDQHTFDPLVKDLPADVTFYALDLPGCGQSDPPTAWRLDAISDAIVEAAKSIPTRFTLVGNCSGALLGISAARRLTKQVERMLLIDIFAIFPWYFKVFLLPALGPLAYYSTFANPVGRWIANAGLTSKRTKESTLTGGFKHASHGNTYRYLELFSNFPRPETFCDLSMPIDIVYGERTFAAVQQSVAKWKSAWPQAEVWRLSGAGHLPIREATGQIREILFRGASGKDGRAPGECLISSSKIAN